MPLRDRANASLVPSLDSILCESCGYTLDGLPAQGNCPECGTPIAHSTTATPRIPPKFEVAPSWGSFIATAMDVIRRPKQFFKTLRLQPRANSNNFRMRALVLLSIVAGAAAALHYNWAIAFWGFLPGSFVAIGICVFIGAVAAKVTLISGLILNRPIVWLTTLESGFWGFRLPKDRVQKALDYQIAQTLPAAIAILLAVVVHRVLLVAGVVDGSFSTTYLYTLSGVTVLAVLWVFNTYTKAMRAIMFANAQPVADHLTS
jgi:hypothetical protein